MDATRQQKIARQIQKDLSEILQRETQELFRGKLISVTTVRVSPDLSIAKAYLSIFPSSASQEMLKEVKAASAHIRNLLGRRVRHQLRIVPELTFFLDDSLDYIDHIDELLK